MAQRRHQQGAQQGATQPAQAGPSGQQAEQTLALGGGKQISKHAPGQGDGQQVEYRQPDVEAPGRPQVVRGNCEQDGEQQQVAGKEAIGPRQDEPALHPGRQPAEQWQARQGGDEGTGEQPLQVVHPAGNTHGFAHRAQHEVAGEQQVEQQQAGDDRRPFAGLDVQPLVEPPPPRLHGVRQTA